MNEGFWEMFTSLGAPESFASGSSAFVPLPGCIRPFPTTITVDRIEYLQAQGALALPTIALQNALLQKFVECVLPYMPVLEWPGFINIINARDGSQGQVSLLLFQAVLFSATTFVELEYLLEAGYSSKEEAHERFFEKAKRLYDAGYESDALVVVQSLLLLTHRSGADVGSGAHWCELAISVAQSIRLFHDQASTDSSVYSPKLWRKVGWVCYMTDCLIALQLRRRPRIKRESFGHQMLTPDDFDIFLGPESTLPTVETQGQLNLGSIAQSRLCLCISEVLEIQGRNDQLNWSIVNSPNHENDYIARVTRADKALEDWMVSLPYSCKYRLAGSGEPPAIFVQRSLLHMVYHTTTCVLHQSQTFWSSKARVQHAAGQITQLAVELHNRNLHNWLPRIGVTAILVAMIVHISQIQSVRPLERRELMNSFESCITVMASLQDIHSETKAVTACMLHTMKATMDRNSGSNNDNYSTSFTATPSEARSKLNSECKNETLEDWDMYLTL